MSHHQPVLLTECLNALNIQANGIYVDGTFGRGGHSRALLERLNQQGQLIAFDQDPDAIKEGEALAAQDPRFSIVHANFVELQTMLEQRGLLGQITGLLLDLGVSSPQLDTAERGFSFLRDGPLDMRMNPQQGQSAAKLLQYIQRDELVSLLKTEGEERHAKRIANAIITARDAACIERTGQLADIVAKAHPAWEIGKHPATQTFQALRIAVNQELTCLDKVLPQTLEALHSAGRLAVISFHSLEDRIVKRFIRRCAKGDDYPPDLPVTVDMLNPTLRSLGKAIHANATEVAANPRARSAVLRVAERC